MKSIENADVLCQNNVTLDQTKCYVRCGQDAQRDVENEATFREQFV
jgi:hypothetical protein